MREIGDLGKEGQALGPVNDLLDVADVERLAVGGDEAVGEHAPADQPEFRCVHVFSIVQIHHVNHQRGLQRSCSSFPVSRGRTFMSCCICITSGSSMTTVRWASRSG